MSRTAQPTQLDDLRHKAKEYKRVHGVSHCQALEAIARLAGYRTYAAAKAELEQLPPRKAT